MGWTWSEVALSVPGYTSDLIRFCADTVKQDTQAAFDAIYTHATYTSATCSSAASAGRTACKTVVGAIFGGAGGWFASSLGGTVASLPFFILPTVLSVPLSFPFTLAAEVFLGYTAFRYSCQFGFQIGDHLVNQISAASSTTGIRIVEQPQQQNTTTWLFDQTKNATKKAMDATSAVGQSAYNAAANYIPQQDRYKQKLT